MKIGELARATSTRTETIRFYEREGLLPNNSRTLSNYRIYNDKHIERLQFIRRCRKLDMTLNEIRALLRLNDAEKEACSEVNALLDEHIGHVVERITELKELEKQLKQLRQYCMCRTEFLDQGEVHPDHDLCLCRTSVPHCGILTELSKASADAEPLPETQSHVARAHSRKDLHNAG